MTATLSPDAVSLFAALAGGADPAELCPVIADAMRDSDHPLADVVRLVLPGALRWLAPEGGKVRAPQPVRADPTTCRWGLTLGADDPGDLPRAVLDPVERIGQERWPELAFGTTAAFPTPAAAYLALVEVLAPLLPWHDRRPMRDGQRWVWCGGADAPHRLPDTLFRRLVRLAKLPAAHFATQRDAMLALLAAVTPAKS